MALDLDEGLQNWLKMAIALRSERFTIFTTPIVMERLDDIAERKGWTRSRVAHMAILFGLDNLDKYLEEAGRKKVGDLDFWKGDT